ncbi:uncharacterized protein [Drosophila kikkawai]|uniref:Uncharacterized protein n=1 Tax=Drosophila kikkawai TaxID=30033 RepID=A0A6P4ILN0_DROKI|nr:uncharacterized protein LOC108075485 [Drosophila kikkawai]
MASQWKVALLLTISALLGIAQASITCESDREYKCVDKKDCQTLIDYRSIGAGCPSKQVCCRINEIQQYCGRNNENVCVEENVCGSKVELRSLGPQCPDDLICCAVETDNDLSVMDPEPPRRKGK